MSKVHLGIVIEQSDDSQVSATNRHPAEYFCDKADLSSVATESVGKLVRHPSWALGPRRSVCFALLSIHFEGLGWPKMAPREKGQTFRGRKAVRFACHSSHAAFLLIAGLHERHLAR